MTTNDLFKAMIGVIVMTVAVGAHAAPTRLVTQELGRVAPADSISADLEYLFLSTGITGGLRIGAFRGEVLLNARNTAALDGSDLAITNLGYKASVGRDLAVYGLMSYLRVDPPVGASVSATEFGVGLAYTLRQGALTFNLNPELLTDDDNAFRGGDTTIFVRGGALFELPLRMSGKLSLLGEVTLENSDFLDTTINLGARWELRKDVTIDFVLFNDQGDAGDEQGIPGALKVNIAF
jgi:hypothetical protein